MCNKYEGADSFPGSGVRRQTKMGLQQGDMVTLHFPSPLTSLHTSPIHYETGYMKNCFFRREPGSVYIHNQLSMICFSGCHLIMGTLVFYWTEAIRPRPGVTNCGFWDIALMNSSRLLCSKNLTLIWERTMGNIERPGIPHCGTHTTLNYPEFSASRHWLIFRSSPLITTTFSRFL